MIILEDQNNLFRLISSYIKKDIVCYAFGGTAMMYYGYKDSTKDIDIIFESKEDRNVFIDAIEELGYKKKSPIKVYSDQKLKDKNKPLMYSRGDERFDLFVKKIFQTHLSDPMKKRTYARHDFNEKKSLIIQVLSKEDIILLKSVTERERDFDDILKICQNDNIDWDIIVTEAIEQSKREDGWIIFDLESNMQKLKRFILIKKKYFDMIYQMKK